VVGSTPRVGEHNEDVICGILGYSKEDLAQFKEDQVIGDRDEYDEVPG
jgi:hypothetical protein